MKRLVATAALYSLLCGPSAAYTPPSAAFEEIVVSYMKCVMDKAFNEKSPRPGIVKLVMLSKAKCEDKLSVFRDQLLSMGFSKDRAEEQIDDFDDTFMPKLIEGIVAGRKYGVIPKVGD